MTSTDESPKCPGGAIVAASWVGTGVFGAAALVSSVWLDAAVLVVVVSVVLFALGTLAFLAAYVRAIGRSRHEAIGMGGLFFLAGSAPRSVRVHLTAAFVIEIVIAFVSASVRIYTPVAFGLLVPMYGLGLMGLWGATYGTFDPRQPDPAADSSG